MSDVNQTKPKWQTQIFGILPHPSEPRLLLRPGEEGYSLPCFLLQERGKWIEDSPIKREMQQRLGRQVNILYRAYYTENADQYQAESIYVLESDPPAVIEGQWVGREQLAARYPDYIPMPLRVEPEQRWMLLADFGEQPPYEQATPAQQEAMLCTFGQLQIEATAHVDELLALGLLDRRLDRLATQIEPLFNDVEATAGLIEAELEQLHGLAPQLKVRCEQLVHYPIPQTLVHGDLHTGNVVFPNGRPRFFDWTDACISHPFFDAMLHISHQEDTALQEHLRDRYLSLWTGFAPMARLQEIWAFAQPLFALHHAVSYQQIVARMEDIARHELSSAVPDLLRKALKYMQL